MPENNNSYPLIRKQGTSSPFSCGGFLFKLLENLQIDVREAADTHEQLEMIRTGILNLIEEKCKKDREGITQKISVSITADNQKEYKYFVVEDGRVKQISLDEMPAQDNEEAGPTNKITSTIIGIGESGISVLELYGPLFGRGARCDLVLKDGTASFTNPRGTLVS